jgi:hypothetical protein
VVTAGQASFFDSYFQLSALRQTGFGTSRECPCGALLADRAARDVIHERTRPGLRDGKIEPLDRPLPTLGWRDLTDPTNGPGFISALVFVLSLLIPDRPNRPGCLW